MTSVMSLEHMLALQGTNSQTSVSQPILGKPLSRHEIMQAGKFHGAAVLIQKHIRGQLVRKTAHKDMKAYLFFKRVHRAVNLRSLIFGMKNACGYLGAHLVAVFPDVGCL